MIAADVVMFFHHFKDDLTPHMHQLLRAMVKESTLDFNELITTCQDILVYCLSCLEAIEPGDVREKQIDRLLRVLRMYAKNWKIG